jgi:hypothetical protein
MTPVRRLELAVSDLELLDATVVAAVRALVESLTFPDPAVGVLLDEVGDLRQALDTMAVDPDRGLGRRTTPRELVAILARAVRLLTLPDDVDTAVLGRLVREQAADLALTAVQQQAHQRLCALDRLAERPRHTA